MERDALLLYLQNVRDLEVAKTRLNQIMTDKKEKQDAQLSKYSIEAEYKEAPLKAGRDKGFDFMSFCAWIMLVIGAMMLLCMLMMPELFSEGLFVFMLIVSIVMGPGYLLIKRSNNRADDKHYAELNKQRLEEQQQWNQAQDEMVQKNLAIHHKIRENYKAAITPYQAEMEKVEDLLLSFYNMNVIPLEYRNVTAMCYIYDYMSTSQATLAEALLHEKLENGIQRIESRLNIMLDYLDNVLYETRCIRAENQVAVERIINQNNQMLKKMETAAQNTAEAAEYAQLASNYAHANAYFSLANYLKQ